MNNKLNRRELEFRAKADSTASSGTLESNNSEDFEEDLDDIFEWFAQKNIVKGDPSQCHEEFIRSKKESLKMPQLSLGSLPLTSNLLRRRTAQL
ncbi:MAG: hypothetical protein JST59_01915 [Actinobacteria bacterium]|nr:hypothetical protein [Actinomycetota bacterium]